MIQVYKKMAITGISLVDPIGDRRIAGRWESGYDHKAGGINSELNYVAMTMAVKKRFPGMVH